MLMGSETLEEIVEQEAINETYRSKTLVYLAKHPMIPLVSRRTLRWNILLVLSTVFMLIFCIVCSGFATKNSTLHVPHGLYSQIQMSFNSTRVYEIKQSLNSVGLLALGVQNGTELATSVLYTLVLMLLLLSVAKRLQSDKRCHVTRNQLFVKANRAVIVVGFSLAWLVVIPCLLHTISHFFIFSQLMTPMSTVPSQALSVLTGISMLMFFIFAVGVGGLYIVLAGIYALSLLLISKRRGYYFHHHHANSHH